MLFSRNETLIFAKVSLEYYESTGNSLLPLSLPACKRTGDGTCHGQRRKRNRRCSCFVGRHTLTLPNSPIYLHQCGRKISHPSRTNHSNRITVSRLGYISQTIPLSVSHTSIAIILLKDTTFQLKEVTVKARRVPVKVKTDRLVYNMKANPMKDGNALESFRYIPFITANDKEISIIGKKSTQIYINGHKCTLSGETLQAYLRSLPANDIESIEILHSPNATYRGEGNFAVINIILKNKKKTECRGWPI